MSRTPYTQFRTVSHLEPSNPIGAVVSVGRRSDAGHPILKDRWFVMDPVLVKKEFPKRDGGTWKGDARNPHSAFSDWNRPANGMSEGQVVAQNRENGAVLDLSVMHGFVAHPTIGEGLTSKLWADSLKGQPSPGGRYPACTGNGERASRFVKMDGDEPVYEDIECPEDCPFYGSDCKTDTRFLFIPDWSELAAWTDGRQFPRLLTMWVNHSEQSTENVLGMLTYARNLGIALGIPDPSLVGLPFSMRVTQHTSSIKGTRFPIVEFNIRGNVDEFFAAQKQRQMELSAGPGYVTSSGSISAPTVAALPADVEPPMNAALAEVARVTGIDPAMLPADVRPPSVPSALDAEPGMQLLKHDSDLTAAEKAEILEKEAEETS
jgi:hypothetical protein